MILDILAWLATAGSLASLWLMPSHPKLGWTVLFVNQSVWVGMGLIAGGLGFYAHAIAFGIIAIRGLRKLHDSH